MMFIDTTTLIKTFITITITKETNIRKILTYHKIKYNEMTKYNNNTHIYTNNTPHQYQVSSHPK